MTYYSRNSIFSRDRGYDRMTPSYPNTGRTVPSEPYNLQLVARCRRRSAGGNPARPEHRATPVSHMRHFSRAATPHPQATSIRRVQRRLFRSIISRANCPTRYRYGVFLNVDHKIFGDQVVFLYTIFFLQHTAVHNERQKAPTNTTSFQLQGASPQLPSPRTLREQRSGGPTYAENGRSVGRLQSLQSISANHCRRFSRERLFEFGNRSYDNDTDAFFTTVSCTETSCLAETGATTPAFRYSRIDAEINFTVPSSFRFDRVLNAAVPDFRSRFACSSSAPPSHSILSATSTVLFLTTIGWQTLSSFIPAKSTAARVASLT